jgi:hypothetical protein
MRPIFFRRRSVWVIAVLDVTDVTQALVEETKCPNARANQARFAVFVE